ncbi:hypothetical protein SDRG_08344 [Saprolegnia diclina VS20]|uniref:Zeta toxin domain-containing protein n=1 Tax=Saprolegnia diclina (strain VS20) TaxID=1156394 RepID=T0QK45_SAPDV|nr:hypothetical protein SDRG_08344 [Saprolegnia diclina VS20]EQC34135.1 hypothetical protein SDRG_08344 [Saprolegnia diclina VS20]|eukprot:XP_008612447.1 hypothetical protein SDRG_08344 [Saprolegnia diclina VS20]
MATQRKKKVLVSASSQELLDGLVRHEAYIADPDAAPTADDDDAIELIQTHMSMVFLRANVVYKVKKNVDFGFADFSSVFKRMQACLAETQLNQRLAPTVYLGVVPIYKDKDNIIRISTYDHWTDAREKDATYYANDEFGEVVDWAVKMRRLPNENTCLHLLKTGMLTPALLDAVAAKIARFHVTARKSPSIDAFGSPSAIAANVNENFEQTKTHARAGLVDASVYAHVKRLSETMTADLDTIFRQRVENRYISDTHGDLRLEHVYFLPTAANAPLSTAQAASRYVPPIAAYALTTLDVSALDVVVLDCIEFNERFRYSDPLADVAFFSMDLLRLGRSDLARAFNSAYLDASKQASKANHQLLRFYTAYRSVVRAKVSGFQALDSLMHDTAKSRARAKCHWLVALSLLALPCDRPLLVLIAGLPGTGKSSIAEALTLTDPRWVWVRSDVVRKELAGVPISEKTPGHQTDDVYSAASTQATYTTCWETALEALSQGQRVLVDATFREPAFRTLFIEGAKQVGVAVAVVVCDCNREIVKGRMAKRDEETTHVSDADWTVFEKVEKVWAPFDVDANSIYSLSAAEVFCVSTDKQKELSVQRIRGFLRKLGVE